MKSLFLAALCCFASINNALAYLSDTTKTLTMPQIRVVLQHDRLLSKIPGSVSVLDFKSIRKIAPLTSNELLAKVPGLNVVDEEGAGLRLNIGVRGLDPDRSRNVLVLEDGIPVALNPYGEPEMYFTPAVDKMSSIEVLKGSGQILFGPQTTGGVINMITANPPEKSTATLRTKAGSGGLLSTYGSYGNTVGQTGFVVSYLNKRAAHIGPTTFNLHDLAAKIRFTLSNKSRLGLKIGLYDELSNSTYVGLTQNMYDRGGQDNVRMAPDDLLPLRRYSLALTHQYQVNSQLQWQHHLFAYTTTRNWRRQDFSSNAASPGRTGVVWGDPSIPGGAIYMQKTNGHRNRQFEVVGAESQLKWQHQKQQVQAGMRVLLEQADEQFIIGNKPDASGGNLRDVEMRNGKAFSLYVQDKIALTEKLDVHIGTRLEYFDYARHILRGRFTVNGTTVVADTSLRASNHTLAVIPGFGFNYNLQEDLVVFGGVHRGFAPPRTKDAITAEAVAYDIRQEDSWNSELGLRAAVGESFKAAVTLFSMDFRNQIIPVSQSSGNTNATGLANGGRTSHRGFEADVQFDLARALKQRYALVFSSSITCVDSRYAADRFISSSSGKVNVKGNRLPYAPGLMVSNSIEWETAKGSGIRLSGKYVGRQFADELNTIQPGADGRTGLISSRYVADINAFWKVSGKNITFNLAVKNLTNERYIASRRPQGIRVGIGRQILVGAAFTW